MQKRQIAKESRGDQWLEKFLEKWRKEKERQRRKLERIPKEERLKTICGNLIDANYRSGLRQGILIGQGKFKCYTEAQIRKSIHYEVLQLTFNLKEAGVLPLKG